MVRRSLLLLLVLLGTAAPAPSATAPTAVNPAEAEAARCEERIASVRRDVMNRYEAALQELQITFQKAADLEGALAVRTERQRLSQEGTLAEANFVPDPKALLALQQQIAAKQLELVGQLVNDTVPKLVEFKKAFTVAGRLDEAVAARAAADHLRSYLVPEAPPAPGTVIPVETLLRVFATDRNKADEVYKNQRLTLHGAVVGYRPDADGRHYLIFLGGANPNGGWVQCSFGNEVRFREEKVFNGSALVCMWGSGNDAATLRLQKGSVTEINGNCQGWEDTVHVNKCDFTKPQ